MGKDTKKPQCLQLIGLNCICMKKSGLFRGSNGCQLLHIMNHQDIPAAVTVVLGIPLLSSLSLSWLHPKQKKCDALDLTGTFREIFTTLLPFCG